MSAVFAARSRIRVIALVRSLDVALRTYGWPDNFASLREAADRLTAIARAGSINGAASALGIPRATLHHWYSQILGLSPPLAPPPGAAT